MPLYSYGTATCFPHVNPMCFALKHMLFTFLHKILLIVTCDSHINHEIPNELHILAYYFLQQELGVDACRKIWTHTAINLESNPVWHYIPHEIHIPAHYFHTARITCG